MHVAMFKVVERFLVAEHTSRGFGKLTPKELRETENLHVNLAWIEPRKNTVNTRHQAHVQLDLPRITRQERDELPEDWHVDCRSNKSCCSHDELVHLLI